MFMLMRMLRPRIGRGRAAAACRSMLSRDNHTRHNAHEDAASRRFRCRYVAIPILSLGFPTRKSKLIPS